MVRLRIHQLLKRRHLTAYSISKGTSISYASAHRMSRASGSFGRMHAETLEELCRFFQVQPGALMEWRPG